MKLLSWTESLGRVPVVPLLGFPGVRLTGQSVRSCLSDSAKLAAVARAIRRRFSPDAVFLLMDLTVEAQALGTEIHMPEDDTPSVAAHPVKTLDDVARLAPPDPGRDGRMPVFVDAARLLAGDGDLTVCAYVIGPFTLAAELAGAERLAEATILDPGFVEGLCRVCEESVCRYAAALARAGCSVVAILDPTAVILSPRSFSRFAAPGASAVARAIQKAGAAPVLHICGDTTHLLPAMAHTGVEGLSLDSPVDLPAAASSLPEDLVLIGNLAPVEILLEGTPEIALSRTRELLCAMKGRKGFILSSGCDLPLETPFANLDAFLSAAR
ncbi:MAG: uroporphyrinogen decarboxylase family protein [Thermodesulfobacteriota bacterium]